MKIIVGGVMLALSLLAAAAGAREVATPAADPQTARLVEQALRARGYTAGPADGGWDEASRRALVQFQRAQGLQPTGRADPRTLAMLGVEPERPTP